MPDREEFEKPLPRRDLILLPLTILAVTVVFFGVSHIAASLAFPEKGIATCGLTDASGANVQKPNCVTSFKNWEGPMVEYRYNECGYRSTKPCGPKPPGTLRVVLIGTSVTLGLYIPYDETFAARIEKALNQVCTQRVEVQNAASPDAIQNLPARAAQALTLKPDVMVLTMVPFDLEMRHEPSAAAAATAQPGSPTLISRLKSAVDAVKQVVGGSKLALVTAHYMFQDREMLYRMYSSSGGSRDLLSVPPTESSIRKYDEFGRVLGQIQDTLAGSGVPLIVVAGPNKIGAAMASDRSMTASQRLLLASSDPYRFGRQMGEIAIQHGAIPLDLMKYFAKVPDAEQLFYPVDNHPTGGANQLIAQGLVDLLTSGSIPQMSACRGDATGLR